ARMERSVIQELDFWPQLRPSHRLLLQRPDRTCDVVDPLPELLKLDRINGNLLGPLEGGRVSGDLPVDDPYFLGQLIEPRRLFLRVLIQFRNATTLDLRLFKCEFGKLAVENHHLLRHRDKGVYSVVANAGLLQCSVTENPLWIQAVVGILFQLLVQET